MSVGGEGLFDQMSKQPAYGKPNAGWKKNTTYVHKQRSVWKIYHKHYHAKVT